MRQKIKIISVTLGICMLFSAASRADESNTPKSVDLLKQGDDLFNADNYDQAVQTYIQAAETAKSEGDNSILTEAYSQVARCYLKLEKKEEGRPWLEKAKEVASKDDPPGWARYLSVRGRYEWKDAAEQAGIITPETDKASKTFKDMYAYCVDHGLYGRAIDAANMVSITGHKDERIEWAQKGIEAAEKGNLQSWMATLWNNLGWAYDDVGRYRESLDALEKARVYHYKTGDEQAMLIADWSVGHALRMLGQIDSAATILENVQRLAMIRKGEDKSKTNSEWLGFASLELGEIMIVKGNRQRALNLFKVAYRNLHEAGMYKWDRKKFDEIDEKIKELSKPQK